jgi:hypothetical protein
MVVTEVRLENREQALKKRMLAIRMVNCFFIFVVSKKKISRKENVAFHDSFHVGAVCCDDAWNFA